MRKHRKQIILLAAAWILWEHVYSPDGPERWRSLGSVPSQQMCFSGSQKMAEQGASLYDNAPNRPAGIRVELSRAANPARFEVIGDKGVQRHIFECYPSDFDPRPRG
jgi:hypothetical protein